MKKFTLKTLFFALATLLLYPIAAYAYDEVVVGRTVIGCENRCSTNFDYLTGAWEVWDCCGGRIFYVAR